jgi:hypothetical protein
VKICGEFPEGARFSFDIFVIRMFTINDGRVCNILEVYPDNKSFICQFTVYVIELCAIDEQNIAFNTLIQTVTNKWCLNTLLLTNSPEFEKYPVLE